ncbi:MAG: selenocysteine-specific translation elongation factor [Pseudomonadota bacterium]
MEKYITIGIAGHVDHGKTSLVKCLTGIDTDRRKEEKERGLSIDAGVAELVLPCGRTAVLIDVPGHTDFLKNAIRGLSCVDAAILVVAADDGVMPQTREHLDILSFFKASNGIVVLSKADLVDTETLEIAELELRELLIDTFMGEAPIIPFSSLESSEKGEILNALDRMITALPDRRHRAPVRMWIDQLRSFPGIGTVVSGTVLSGRLRQDDPVELFPIRVRTRARSLESHGKEIHEAFPGQRVGVNLPKISLNTLHRGMALIEPDTLRASIFLNADVHVPVSVRRPIKNRQKIKIHIGTAVTIATVVIMDRKTLAPGESGLVQFRLNRPLAVMARDTYVATLMNIPTVVAGGTILEVPHSKFRPVKAGRIISYLEALRQEDLNAFVERFFQHEPHRFLTARELSQATGFSESSLQATINSKVSCGEFVYFKGKGAVARNEYDTIKSKIYTVLQKKIEADPVRKNISLGEIAASIPKNIDENLLLIAAEDLTSENRVIKLEGGYHLPDALNRFSPQSEKLSSLVEDFAEKAGISPFSAERIWKENTIGIDKSEFQHVLNFMCTQKKLVRLKDNRFLSTQAMEEIKMRVKTAIEKKGSITLKDSAEILGYGRWGGAPVFDYLDKIGFTARVGNDRVLKRYDR